MKILNRITALIICICVLLLNAAFCFSCVTQSTSGNTSSTHNHGQPGITTSGKENGPDSQKPSEKPDLNEKDPVLLMTEIMAQKGYALFEGKSCQFVELRANAPLELNEYSILRSSGERLALPEKHLEAGEYYLIIIDGDTLATPLDTSESLTLMHGTLISQTVTYINRSENRSFDVATGGECATPTPGYDQPLPPDGPLINELMSDNGRYPIDGCIGDWIELYNSHENELSLSDYWISDDPEDPYLCRLPEERLGAGEYYLLRGENELSFGLSKSGECVYITRYDGVVCASLTFGEVEKNCSYTRDGGVSRTPSPGRENTEAGMLEYLFDRSTLVINEVISSNSAYAKYNGDYFDAVEICNISFEDIELGQYYLSDKLKELQRFRLPEITLKSGECYTVYCTGKGGNDPSFSISSHGEDLYITRADGYVCDTMCVPELLHNVSYGRYERALVYFETPTLGKINSKIGYPQVSTAPKSTVESGFFTQGFEISLEGDGDIYYTLDGSKPTLSSALYKGERLSIPQGLTNLRMICKKGELITSREQTYTYCVSLPEYTLPIIAVSVNHEDMFGENGTWTLESKSEIEGHVAYFEDGTERFSIGCGVKLFGNGSVTFPKKSLQLKFRGKYGASSLEYKMFDDLDIDSFNSIVIRSGSQAVQNCLINDEFVTSLVATSGNMPTVPVQAFKPCNLYINGEYMGVYFIREKLGDDYFASHLGVSPESVTMVYRRKYVECGSDGKEWKELWSFILENDLRIKENYEYITQCFDIENLADFLIAEMWCGNRDTLNMRVYKSSDADGKWRYILYDLDRAFYYTTSGAVHFLGEYVTEGKPYNPLFYKILQNDEFYAYFMERFAFHMENTFDPEVTLAHFNSIVSMIEQDMPYEIERWKNETELTHNQSMAKWIYQCNRRRTRLTVEYNDAFALALDEVCIALRKDESIH